jgi:sugar/nucleoside kinase (ribokinase family)
MLNGFIPDVVVVGHIIIETIIFPNGEAITPVLGSPAAYSSVAMSKLGTRVLLCTKIGSDMPPKLMEPFKKTGVDISRVKTEGKHSTSNKLFYTHFEKKRIEYMHRAPTILADDLGEAAMRARIVYVCPMDFEFPINEVCKLGTGHGKVIVDMGGYGGATSSSHQHGDSEKLQELRSLLEVSSIVKTSLEDASLIFDADNSPIAADSPERLYAERYMELGAKRLVITLGSRGAYYCDQNGEEYFAPFKCESRDTTGAGDTFAAGFVHEYLKTGSVSKAIRFGNAVACIVVQKTGGVVPSRMPDEKKVIDFVATYSNSSRSKKEDRLCEQ